MLINQFAFQRVKVTFHRRIIIRTSCATHALLNIVHFAVFRELSESELGNPGRCAAASPDCELGGYVSSAHTRNNAPVSQIENCAIIPHSAVFKTYIREICTPFSVSLVGCEIALEPEPQLEVG